MTVDKQESYRIFKNIRFYYPGDLEMYYIDRTEVDIKPKEKTGEYYHKIILKNIEIDLPDSPFIVRIEALCDSTGNKNIIFPHSITVKNNNAIIETLNMNEVEGCL